MRPEQPPQQLLHWLVVLMMAMNGRALGRLLLESMPGQGAQRHDRCARVVDVGIGASAVMLKQPGCDMSKLQPAAWCG